MLCLTQKFLCTHVVEFQGGTKCTNFNRFGLRVGHIEHKLENILTQYLISFGKSVWGVRELNERTG